MWSHRSQEAHLSHLRFAVVRRFQPQAYFSRLRWCQEADSPLGEALLIMPLNTALSCVQSIITCVISFELYSNPVKWARVVLLSPINR